MCGDCSVEENRRALLGDAVMELVYTDPPYDMDYSGGRGCFEKSLRNVKKALAPMVRFDPYTLRWLADFPAPSYYIWTSKNARTEIYRHLQRLHRIQHPHMDQDQPGPVYARLVPA